VRDEASRVPLTCHIHEKRLRQKSSSVEKRAGEAFGGLAARSKEQAIFFRKEGEPGMKTLLHTANKICATDQKSNDRRS